MRAIFISYRREDAEGQAGRLFKDLVQHFGEQAVFMDVAAIEPGRDFRKAIDEHVATCGVLLALIGKDWVGATDEAGRRRLDDPGDFVRLETVSALKREIPVVPVLVQGARMPRAEQLPADLQSLAYRNAIELTHARWDSDLTVLIKALSRYVTPAHAVAASLEPKGDATNGPSRQSRNLKLPAIAIAAVVIAAAAGLFFFPRKDDNPVQAATSPAASGEQGGSIEPAPRPESGGVSGSPVQPPASDSEVPTGESPKPTPGLERYYLFGLADWDRDGHQDIVSRQNANDDLWLYPGESKRGPGSVQRVQIGNGWKGFTTFGVVDWDRDGFQDIVTRNDATGDLMLYPGEGRRGPGTVQPTRIGTGWNGFTFFGAADWDGDGHQDIVARNESTGDLMLYPGESVRRMSDVQPSKIGTGWNSYTFVGMADWDRDGHCDIVARNNDSGALMLFPGEGVRRMSNIQPTQIGNGWNGYSFFGIADWDRDGHQDIVTRRDSSGDLMLYPGESTRRMSTVDPVRIGNGF